jgi:hypothetical protein
MANPASSGLPSSKKETRPGTQTNGWSRILVTAGPSLSVRSNDPTLNSLNTNNSILSILSSSRSNILNNNSNNPDGNNLTRSLSMLSSNSNSVLSLRLSSHRQLPYHLRSTKASTTQ